MLALLSRILTGGVVERIAAAYEARARAETDADRIAADVEIARIQATASRGFWIDLLTFAAGVPLVLHMGCVALVSTFPGTFDGWTVLALPAPMDEWQGAMILSLFGLTALRRFR